MFYDKLEAPPVPGSLKEALCILVFRYRQEQEFYGLLSGLHTDKKMQQECFEKYKRAKFPYVLKTAVDERDRTAAVLARAFEQGPILIKPIEEKTTWSKSKKGS